VLDYHLHLWPHGQRDTVPTLEDVEKYCTRALSAGVTEIALTEHLFRFVQADHLLSGFWNDDPNPALRASMAAYWDEHAHADLDTYVNCVEEAKTAGLPVVLGLEVDYYRGHMEAVRDLLDGYPFDVLLGSVHWIGAWRFDDLRDPASMEEWSVREVDSAWDDYTSAVEELSQSETCDVLAHPDLIKVTGRRPRHPEECWDRLTEAAYDAGMAAELNSAGWRKPVGEVYPDRGLLERFVERGVPLTTASDAHDVADVADRVDDMSEILRSLQVDSLHAYRKRQATPVPLGSRTERP
jgi:histidinol-phosphatase (PHP family)